MINYKGSGRKRSWPYFKALSRHSPGGTEENHDNLSHDIRCPSWNLKSGPTEYGEGKLITRPRRLF
jgi:hypothetical protein